VVGGDRQDRGQVRHGQLHRREALPEGARLSAAAPARTWATALLLPLFFASGVPALLYQVVWQRALFTIYGTNAESATAVVAAFLLGLGLGARIGGQLASRWPGRLLLIYATIEFGIGLYGVVSLMVFDWVGNHFAAASMTQTGSMAFILVVLPTVLMGATLPILAAYLVARRGHVGNGVGALYFVNTLGSAFACFLASELLMGWLGQHGTIQVAAGVNLVVGLGAVLLSRLSAAEGGAAAPEPPPLFTLGMHRAALLAGIAGYISLSFEMLWLRAYGFLSSGSARDFAHVLGFFLAGIALGGLAGRPLSRLASRSVLLGRLVPTGLFALSSLLALACAPAMALIPTEASPLLSLPAVGFVAGIWAALFPVLAHLAVAPGRMAGAGIGRLYLANVAGAVAGCLLTGFVLMDHLTTADVSAAVTAVGVFAALVLWADAPAPQRLSAVAGLALLAIVIGLGSAPLYADLYQRLLYRGAPEKEEERFANVVETRAGVIAVTREGVIYGGGEYDGRVSVDFVHDTNGIVRPFSLSAFHPAPRRVLMIGLSVGAWGQVIANHPQLEQLVVVEINPGYLELTRRYPNVASLMSNPKVTFVIDDGRRWLRNHQGEGFDMVVMNTTWHWRSFVSNLLSREFLDLVRPVLREGGLLYYNTTGSREVQRTASMSYPYTLRFTTMMLASSAPIRLDVDRWEAVMRQYRIDGKPVVGDDAESAEVMRYSRERLRTLDAAGPEYHDWNTLESRERILAETEDLREITDDGMGLEWRRGKPSYY
jgi:spermidine synthase